MKGEKEVWKMERTSIEGEMICKLCSYFFFFLIWICIPLIATNQINSNDPQFEQFLRSKHGSPFRILQCIICCATSESTDSAQLMFDPLISNRLNTTIGLFRAPQSQYTHCCHSVRVHRLIKLCENINSGSQSRWFWLRTATEDERCDLYVTSYMLKI